MNAIKEIIINDYPINVKTKWDNIKNESKIIKTAYRLLIRGLYPTAVHLILNHSYKNLKLEIIVSNHNAFKKLKREKPEYFDCVGNISYNNEIKQLFNLD
jgi:hypothetical protein